MIIDQIILIASAVVKKNRKVLLLQRGDKSSYPDHWQLPEGKMEEGELPDPALKREVKEEIGIRIKGLKFQSVFYKNLKAKGLQYLIIRTVYEVIIYSNKIELSQEHTAYGWFSKKEALNLPLLPGIKEILQDLM